MKYKKPAFSYEEKADYLIKRGLCAEKDILIARLEAVNYYRLSGYWYPFLNDDNTFKKNTRFDTVWKRYTFDRHLRLLVMDAIERVEVGIRTNMTYELAHLYGPFGYLNPDNLPKLTGDEHSKFLHNIENEQSRSKECFVESFFKKYGNKHKYLPIWMAAEIMSFGTTKKIFLGTSSDIRRNVSSKYRISATVLDRWLLVLNTVRNICAHHSRLWNKEFGLRLSIPRGDSQWNHPVKVPDNRTFGVLTVLKYLLDIIAPQSNWLERFNGLLKQYPENYLHFMGFPEDWLKCPIWKCNN